MRPVLQGGVGGFSNVDASHPDEYIAYLDACARDAAEGQAKRFASQGIGPGMRVLDVGCGTGDDVRALSAIVTETGYVAGIDSSAALIAEAERRGTPPNASMQTASAYQLPFPDASFDAARAERVLQHLSRPHDALQEVHRILKPGGSLQLLDQDWDTIAIAGADTQLTRSIIHAFTDSLANGTAGRNHRALLTRAGFQNINVIAGTTPLPLTSAYAFVLESAIQAALASNTVTQTQADTWLASLVEANTKNEFLYTVTVFITTATR